MSKKAAKSANTTAALQIKLKQDKIEKKIKHLWTFINYTQFMNEQKIQLMILLLYNKFMKSY